MKNACFTLNFPLRIAFAASHRFCMVVFIKILKKNYFWLCWMFVDMWAFLSFWGAGATHHLLGKGFSLQRLLLRSVGSRCVGFSSCGIRGLSGCTSWAPSTGSIVGAHGARCSLVCEIFPDQGSNQRLLHWQADSLPLSRQESPSL